MKIRNILTLLRIEDYIKNLFVFLPLFFAGQLLNSTLLIHEIIAFIAFSFAASSIYILNDYLDLEEDKTHPTKRHRALASGLVSTKTAFFVMGILFLTATVLMSMLSINALFVVLTYIVLNIGYCFYLKHVAILDITIIAIGFILRLFVGAVVADVHLSNWIVIMTFLLALFLAIGKRRDDVLHFMKTGDKMRRVVDGYNLQFIDSSMQIMAAIVVVSYILYTTSSEVLERVRSEYLYITSLFVLLGVLRYLQISIVEKNSGSPTKIILNDTFIILTVIAWVLSFASILYL